MRWIISDVGHAIDPQQFGCLKGSSTTFCLLDMLHNWLQQLDSPGQFLRVSFLDFSKAFDRIDHTIVIHKLTQIGVRYQLIPWICSFLSGRTQSVKVGGSTSDWAPIVAGVPQGTKLGPILFLIMINDLARNCPLKSRHWMYVDDITISESVARDATPAIQDDLDTISRWASTNNMRLNPKKCKELAISFLRSSPAGLSSPLHVNNVPLERVKEFKVLGLTVQNDLRWNTHIDNITKKASKRLHIIRVLRNAGVPPQDLVKIYIALIRSILEYCCPVWSTCIPSYLSDKIEKLQKRALRILFPDLSYEEALARTSLPRLDDRRNSLCAQTVEKIACDPSSRLHSILPSTRADSNGRRLRNASHFSLFKCRTERFRSSFFPSAIADFNRNL